MPVNRYSLGDERVSYFHVIEEFEVYTGEAAIVLDHLLNHIKVLHGVAGGVSTTDLAECLSRYSHYGVTKEDYVDGATPASLMSTVLHECILLTQYFLEISSIFGDDERKGKLMEEIQRKVPFLDYRYPRDAYQSETDRDA